MHPVGLEAVDSLLYLGFVHRLLDLAGARHLLRDLDPAGARNEGRRFADEGIADRRPRPVAYLQDVAEALCGDQARLGPLALDQGIDHHCGAVDHERAVAHGDPRRFNEREGARGGIVGGGEALMGKNLTPVFIEDRQVGEGAADIPP